MSVLALLIVVGLLNSVLGDGSAESLFDSLGDDADDAQDGTDDFLPPGDTLTDFVVGTLYVNTMEEHDQ